MRKLNLMFLAFAIIFLNSVVVFATTTVKRATMTSGLENREPVDENSEFDNSIGKVFCFSEIETDESPTTVTHVWFYGEKIMAEVSLQINGKRWRTKSSKNILKSWTGDWKVEIRDQEGNVLKELKFTINEPVEEIETETGE